MNKEGIRPSDKHLTTIRNYPMPTNYKELRRCLGMFTYFRQFIANFSRIARPMLDLTKKDVTFLWTEECTSAFLNLRDRLTEAPILSVYNPHRETELHTDASSHGFGAVLLQKQDDGKFHPVAYYSKATTPPESRYHSFELETLAIIYGLNRFKMFLDGIPFTIVTDCNSLTLTLNKKMINPRIARWALELENYDYRVKHRRGELMGHVDVLSRKPVIAAVDANEVDVNIQISRPSDC